MEIHENVFETKKMEAKIEKINTKTVEQYIQYRSEKMDRELRTGYQYQ